MKTREEVEYLKREWRKDPIWDIEDTEDFEEYRSELFMYRMECEAEWYGRRQDKIQEKAEECSTREVGLVEYVMELEERLERLEELLGE